jgi:hypothetical protein
MTAEAKIRTLAQQDATLQSFFGGSNGTFRMFDRQLQPNYLKPGATCCRVRRISTVQIRSHETATQRSDNSQVQPRFQIDVLDFSAETARAAAAAICDWLARVDFSTNDQFDSPVTTPKRHPNFVLNQRADMEFTTQPPAYVETLDVRIFNLEE